MANLSNQTRRDQVLLRLEEAEGDWVDGTDLATAEVGGSEGLKRLRELRTEFGHDIRKRKHPDPDRDIYQYRLVPPQERSAWSNQGVHPDPVSDPPIAREATTIEIPKPAYEPAEKYDYRRAKKGNMRLGKTEDGKYAAVYDGPDPEPLPVDDRQTDMGIPEAPLLKFKEMPTHLELGRQIICPRCKGRRKHNAATDTYARRTHDPYHPSQDCMRCDGFGVVPAP